jgi:Cu/Zn superoxide dismutase
MGDPDANHPYHMGDLPNLVANASGKATVKCDHDARHARRRSPVNLRC